MTDALNNVGRDAAPRSIHLRVTGRVQGVYFRAWLAELAESLKLRGWVRNRHDGSVEAVISGKTDAVAQMVSSCHRGPPDAQVEKVEVIGEAEEAPPGFRVLPTA